MIRSPITVNAIKILTYRLYSPLADGWNKEYAGSGCACKQYVLTVSRSQFEQKVKVSSQSKWALLSCVRVYWCANKYTAIDNDMCFSQPGRNSPIIPASKLCTTVSCYETRRKPKDDVCKCTSVNRLPRVPMHCSSRLNILQVTQFVSWAKFQLTTLCTCSPTLSGFLRRLARSCLEEHVCGRYMNCLLIRIPGHSLCPSY